MQLIHYFGEIHPNKAKSLGLADHFDNALNFGNWKTWHCFAHNLCRTGWCVHSYRTIFPSSHWQVHIFWTHSICCDQRSNKLHWLTPWNRQWDSGNELSTDNHAWRKSGHQKLSIILHSSQWFQEQRWSGEAGFCITRAICYNTVVPEIWIFPSTNRHTKDNTPSVYTGQTAKRWINIYRFITDICHLGFQSCKSFMFWFHSQVRGMWQL